MRADHDSLERMFTHIPRAPQLLSGPDAKASWVHAWSARHTLAAVALTPLLFWLASTILPTLPFVWAWLVGLGSIIGALALATYVPLAADRGTATPSAPCSRIAGLLVLMGLFALAATAPSVFGAVVYVVCAAGALAQRTLGTTCA
ncbi:hypothetical protein ACQP1U_01600 [Actinomycetota bacterium]